MNTRIKIWSAAALLLASGSGMGYAFASTSGGSPAPSAYTSWKAQMDAQVKCAKVLDDNKWEVCLLTRYSIDTKKDLNAAEYVTNGAKGTWKVTWSHVTLPSGGKALKKAEKVDKGIPTTVYCKRYTDGAPVVLCNNGFRV